MNTFSLKIIASNKIFFDGEAESLTLPLIDYGSESFLAYHENCITPIVFGEMKIVDSNGKETNGFVGNGVFEFLDNTAVLVCVSAEMPEEIDARRAQEAKERAEEEMHQKQSLLEYYHSQANLARAMERLKVKNRH